jgi:NAD(P)-dependent dehydrogenase (short-subunit alcohol dehydrogenase family)
MTTNIGTGTVLITGLTSGLSRALTLELAGRAESDRPDLLLARRPGEWLIPDPQADRLERTGYRK